MLDDMLIEIFGEATLGRLTRSRRAQLLLRLFFGLLGAGLGAVGAVHFATKEGLTTNLGMRLSMVGMLAFMGAFWLFNVAFARRWRWPGLMFVVSFVALFATRILFGP